MELENRRFNQASLGLECISYVDRRSRNYIHLDLWRSMSVHPTSRGLNLDISTINS